LTGLTFNLLCFSTRDDFERYIVQIYSQYYIKASELSYGHKNSYWSCWNQNSNKNSNHNLLVKLSHHERWTQWVISCEKVKYEIEVCVCGSVDISFVREFEFTTAIATKEIKRSIKMKVWKTERTLCINYVCRIKFLIHTHRRNKYLLDLDFTHRYYTT